jgi:murein DD-endopeptidase MepM/ murein hydrolase activator NlpD
MNKKRGAAQRIIEFFEGKGFYIILFLCIAAIGISGYVLFFANPGQTPESKPEDYTLNEPAWTPQPIEDMTEDIPAEEAAGPAEVSVETPEPAPAMAPSATPKPKAIPKPSATPAVTPKPAKLVCVWPLKGKIAVPYAVDTLVFDSTMGDWRVHPGIDIEAPLGTKVSAAADGTVEDIYEDELMGTTVVILHDGGIRSVYSNLVKKPTVTISQKVKCGDVIGAVGDTAIAEWGVVSHLHMEVIKDGGQINPEDFLPKQQ